VMKMRALFSMGFFWDALYVIIACEGSTKQKNWWKLCRLYCDL